MADDTQPYIIEGASNAGYTPDHQLLPNVNVWGGRVITIGTDQSSAAEQPAAAPTPPAPQPTAQQPPITVPSIQAAQQAAQEQLADNPDYIAVVCQHCGRYVDFQTVSIVAVLRPSGTSGDYTVASEVWCEQCVQQTKLHRLTSRQARNTPAQQPTTIPVPGSQ